MSVTKRARKPKTWEQEERVRELRRLHYAEMTPEQKAEYGAQRQRVRDQRHARLKAEWLAEHGSLPLCECGCGEEVAWTQNTPPRFVSHHSVRVTHQVFQDGRIPNHKLTAQLRKIKDAKGWTWQDMADRAGVSRDSLMQLVSGKIGVKMGHDRQYVTDLLKRLAGIPMPPSPYQLKQMQKKAQVRLPGGTPYVRTAYFENKTRETG